MPEAEKKKIVVHISAVHFSHDSRIVYRECITLSKKFKVKVIIPNPDQDWKNKLDMLGIPFFKHPLARILFQHPIIAFKALYLRANIYHIHDPELIPIGLLLKLLGKKVIFDIHENIPEHIKVMKNTGWLLYWPYRVGHYLSKHYFNIVLAEQSYKKFYPDNGTKPIVIQNFPIIDFFSQFNVNDRASLIGNDLFYIGGVSLNRCIDVIIDTMALLRQRFPDVKLHIFGRIGMPFSEIEKLPRYNEVKDILIFYNRTRPDVAYELAQKCKIGVALLKPLGNYVESYTTKMFEYMAVGLPVVTSNFQLYKDVIEKHSCGFCVNPLDAHETADAIAQILNNPSLQLTMGANGRNAAQSFYNWETEGQRLLQFYDYLLSNE